MNKTLGLLLAVMMFTSITGAAAETSVKPGLTPDNPFYITEQFVEGLEVELAGLIGGESMKAKAMANNAEERLAEAKEIKAKNKTEQAEKLALKYSKSINNSRDTARKSGNSQLENKIKDISDKKTEILKEVKSRAPEDAQKGLKKALTASNKTPDIDKRSDIQNKTNIVGNKSLRPNKTGLKHQRRNISGKRQDVKNTSQDLKDALRGSNDSTTGLLPTNSTSNTTDQERDGIENTRDNLTDTIDNDSTNDSETGEKLSDSVENSLTGQATDKKPVSSSDRAESSGDDSGKSDGKPVEDLGSGLN